ncbi:TetR/AcrR family transcriptional regulator [Acinetobacter piscicola]|uniref:TetR/AcrR family transcriptional regulator n=2 Tax=Acinetobacter TaxID=469 RepID=UPI000B7E22BA|nr:TetR/AcrR family transcriptional regulator [Acinetobacter piscicola]
MSKSAIKILTTAEELFNKNSFTSVGVDLIRDESGCSKTTMYTYFKNKQQLVAEVLKQRDLRFRQSLMEFVADSEGLDALEKIYDWHMLWFQQDHFKGCLFVRAVAESSVQDTEIKEISIAHKTWLRQLIHHYSLQVNPDQFIADIFYNLIEGLISRFLVEGFHSEIAQQQRAMIFQLIESYAGLHVSSHK